MRSHLPKIARPMLAADFHAEKCLRGIVSRVSSLEYPESWRFLLSGGLVDVEEDSNTADISTFEEINTIRAILEENSNGAGILSHFWKKQDRVLKCLSDPSCDYDVWWIPFRDGSIGQVSFDEQAISGIENRLPADETLSGGPLGLKDVAYLSELAAGSLNFELRTTRNARASVDVLLASSILRIWSSLGDSVPEPMKVTPGGAGSVSYSKSAGFSPITNITAADAERYAFQLQSAASLLDDLTLNLPAVGGKDANTWALWARLESTNLVLTLEDLLRKDEMQRRISHFMRQLPQKATKRLTRGFACVSSPSESLIVTRDLTAALTKHLETIARPFAKSARGENDREQRVGKRSLLISPRLQRLSARTPQSAPDSGGVMEGSPLRPYKVSFSSETPCPPTHDPHGAKDLDPRGGAKDLEQIAAPDPSTGGTGNMIFTGKSPAADSVGPANDITNEMVSPNKLTSNDIDAAGMEDTLMNTNELSHSPNKPPPAKMRRMSGRTERGELPAVPAAGEEEVEKRTSTEKPLIPVDLPAGLPCVEVEHEKFAIVRQLSKGGSSKVYHVVDVYGRSWAMKHVSMKEGGMEDDEEMPLLFKMQIEEARLIRSLQDVPGVIKVYCCEIDVSRLDIKIVMELANGGDMNGLITKELDPMSPIPAEILRQIVKQMVSCVCGVHKHRIVHGDLKPANFVVFHENNSYRLSLIDFGIADEVSAATTHVLRAKAVGSLHYMAPESLCPPSPSRGGSQQLSRAADIWALGTIIYRILYKKHIVESKSKKSKKKLPSIQEMMMFLASVPQTMKIGSDDEEPIKLEPVKTLEGASEEEINSLLDLMRGCLRWQPQRRYRSEDLLNHPFIKDRCGKELPDRKITRDSSGISLEIGSMNITFPLEKTATEDQITFLESVLALCRVNAP